MSLPVRQGRATRFDLQRCADKDFNELCIPNNAVLSKAGAISVECYETKAALEAGMKDLESSMATVDYTSSVFAGPEPSS